MAISRVEIKDFLVFKGEFAVDFCPGVNIIIGANGTGKTTLLREMYYVVSRKPHYLSDELAVAEKAGITYSQLDNYTWGQLSNYTWSELSGKTPNALVCFDENEIASSVFIPEKDILEHSRGLLPFIEEKQTGFGRVYKNLLIGAMDVPTNYQTESQQRMRNSIIDIIGGEVEYDNNSGEFITIRTDGTRIPFTYEASGYKKLGLLGLFVKCGKLTEGTVLFWDEPENSLNPENIPVLANILLELSRNGVQIFLATHSELFASYINVSKGKQDVVMFYSLYKDGDGVNADINDSFEWLNPNNLNDEPVKLYELRLDKVFGNE